MADTTEEVNNLCAHSANRFFILKFRFVQRRRLKLQLLKTRAKKSLKTVMLKMRKRQMMLKVQTIKTMKKPMKKKVMPIPHLSFL